MRVGIGSFSCPGPEGETRLLAGVPVPGGAVAGEGGASRDLLVPAVADALLGAAGLGSFRSRFGSGGEGAAHDASDVLGRAVRRVERENYQVVNVDVSLRGLPRPAEGLEGRVASRLAASLHAAPSAVSVKWSAEDPSADVPPSALVVVLLDQIGDIDALHASIRGG